MGFLARRLTRTRTAPVTVEVRLPLDTGPGWATDAALVTGAVVRAAVAEAPVGRAESTAMRGRQSGLLTAFSGKPSTLWVERTGTHGWQVSLGVPRADGLRALDWMIAVEVVRSAGGVVAQLTTPEYLTHEDALVNGKVHDGVRDALAARFGGSAADWDAEERISRHSLQQVADQLAAPPSDTVSAAFDAETLLSAADVLTCLNRIALPSAASPPGASRGSRHWRLGLAEGPNGRGCAEVVDEGERRRVRGTVQVFRTSDGVADAVAAGMATILYEGIQAELHRRDPHLTWAGPGHPFLPASEV